MFMLSDSKIRFPRRTPGIRTSQSRAQQNIVGASILWISMQTVWPPSARTAFPYVLDAGARRPGRRHARSPRASGQAGKLYLVPYRSIVKPICRKVSTENFSPCPAAPSNEAERGNERDLAVGRGGARLRELRRINQRDGFAQLRCAQRCAGADGARRRRWRIRPLRPPVVL